ncbi:hypothetical protein [Halalkalibacter alkaliphilus]|uniref:DOD-type homing endonuclease domain-containing protein n=1 Tax=Halalkalibacter alkaliphilus TaxID=2917993 RepID=A0A9X2CSL0_9BACI|nr:hypothetical protein [Halalkalibacter alkaliphilus]MCL7747335.1 hypothetical protein [Halalkalibacter alkaliphilus]
MKKTNCAWCGKEIFTNHLKERNYCKECYGFANAVRNGTYIKQVKAELKEITWNKDIAYLIGVIATDGTLRRNRPQIKITSKSKRFLTDLLYKIIIEFTGRDQNVNEVTAKFQEKEYTHYQLQFTSTPFYEFCLRIGLEPKKTYTLNKLAIPDEYFSDFLRGVIDGDGNYNLDKRRKTTSIRIYSGSEDFLKWIDAKCIKLFGVSGAKFHKSSNELGEKYILVYHSFHDVVNILARMYSDYHVCYEDKKEAIIDILNDLENLKQKYAAPSRIGQFVKCAYGFCENKFVAKANDHFYCSINCGDKQRKYPNKERLMVTCARHDCQQEFLQTTANNKYCSEHLSYKKSI